MTYTVIFSTPAEADLFAIYDYIAERAGTGIALSFVESIEAHCLGFASMPERGMRRDDLRWDCAPWAFAGVLRFYSKSMAPRGEL